MNGSGRRSIAVFTAAALLMSSVPEGVRAAACSVSAPRTGAPLLLPAGALLMPRTLSPSLAAGPSSLSLHGTLPSLSAPSLSAVLSPSLPVKGPVSASLLLAPAPSVTHALRAPAVPSKSAAGPRTGLARTLKRLRERMSPRPWASKSLGPASAKHLSGRFFDGAFSGSVLPAASAALGREGSGLSRPAASDVRARSLVEEHRRIVETSDIGEKASRWEALAVELDGRLSDLDPGVLRPEDVELVRAAAKILQHPEEVRDGLRGDEAEELIAGLRARAAQVKSFEGMLRDVTPGVREAEIVIAVPYYNEGDTVQGVVRTVRDGLKRYFPGRKAVIVAMGEDLGEGSAKVLGDYFAWKGRPDLAEDPVRHHPHRRIEDLRAEVEDEDIQLVNVIKPKNNRGKGYTLLAAMRIMKAVGASRYACYDADLTSIHPEWVRLHIEPLMKDADMTAPVFATVPFYERHHFDGTITNNLVFPLFRAVYGSDIRQPIGGEYGFGERMVDVLLRDPSVLLTNKATWGTDNWFVSQALAGGARILQVHLGIKKHNESDKKHVIDGEEVDALSLMFIEVADVVFSEIADNIASARAAGENHADVLKGDEIGEVEPQEVGMDPSRNIRAFRKAFLYGPNREVYRTVLGEGLFSRVESLAPEDGEDFAIPSEMWADIVYAFVLAYRFSRGIGRSRLLRSLMWLYKARAGSFGAWLEGLQGGKELAEELFWHQAKVFRLRKPAFLKKWDEFERAEAAGTRHDGPFALDDSEPADAPGPEVHTEMVKRLLRSGLPLKSLMTDIRELSAADAREVLESKGWSLEPGRAVVSYVLGRAHLFGSGQRAVFYEDGRRALATFEGPFVQIIEMDPDGRVTANAVTRLDR